MSREISIDLESLTVEVDDKATRVQVYELAKKCLEEAKKNNEIEIVGLYDHEKGDLI